MINSVLRLAVCGGMAMHLLVPAAAATSAPTSRGEGQAVSGGDEWIYLGVVADTGGHPGEWLGDTRFEVADAADKTKFVPKIGDRSQCWVRVQR